MHVQDRGGAGVTGGHYRKEVALPLSPSLPLSLPLSLYIYIYIGGVGEGRATRADPLRISCVRRIAGGLVPNRGSARWEDVTGRDVTGA